MIRIKCGELEMDASGFVKALAFHLAEKWKCEYMTSTAAAELRKQISGRLGKDTFRFDVQEWRAVDDLTKIATMIEAAECLGLQFQDIQMIDYEIQPIVIDAEKTKTAP